MAHACEPINVQLYQIALGLYSPYVGLIYCTTLSTVSEYRPVHSVHACDFFWTAAEQIAYTPRLRASFTSPFVPHQQQQQLVPVRRASSLVVADGRRFFECVRARRVCEGVLRLQFVVHVCCRAETSSVRLAGQLDRRTSLRRLDRIAVETMLFTYLAELTLWWSICQNSLGWVAVYMPHVIGSYYPVNSTTARESPIRRPHGLDARAKHFVTGLRWASGSCGARNRSSEIVHLKDNANEWRNSIGLYMQHIKLTGEYRSECGKLIAAKFDRCFSTTNYVCISQHVNKSARELQYYEHWHKTCGFSSYAASRRR